MMGWPGYGEWSWLSMGIMMVLFWIPVVALVAWILSPRTGIGGRSTDPSNGLSGREILDQRYARGELTQDQYRSMVADMERGGAHSGS